MEPTHRSPIRRGQQRYAIPPTSNPLKSPPNPPFTKGEIFHKDTQHFMRPGDKEFDANTIDTPCQGSKSLAQDEEEGAGLAFCFFAGRLRRQWANPFV